MTPAHSLRLGELLTRAGLVDPRKLEEALSCQASTGERLGEVLVKMGLIERDELPALLALQSGLRQGEPEVGDGLRLGQLLVEAGAVDPASLEAALGRSRRTGRRIGETLVEAGAISSALLQRFLERQRRLAAVAVAGLALAGGLNGPASAGERASIQVAATVQSRAFIEAQRLPHQVAITAQDVARGYVDVDEALEVGIRSNHAAGVVLALGVNSLSVQSIDVRAAQGGEARAEGIFVPQSGRGLQARTVSLKLRLKLAPSAAPGTIVFPVTVSLAPA